MKFVTYAIQIKRLYKWGTGWSIKDAERWDKYFRTVKKCYWRFLKDEFNTEYLVNVNAGAMIHPMDGIKVTFPIVFDSDMDYIQSAIDELNFIFNGLKDVYSEKKIEIISEKTVYLDLEKIENLKN